MYGVFIAQTVENCSTKAEAMSSNPVEVLKTFFGFICNCVNCNNHCNDHIVIQNLYFRSSHHLQSINIVTRHCCLSFSEVLA